MSGKIQGSNMDILVSQSKYKKMFLNSAWLALIMEGQFYDLYKDDER